MSTQLDRGAYAETGDLDRLVHQPDRVKAMEKAIFSVADRLNPVVDLCKPYVDGLEQLPRDGRVLLVANHTAFGVAEIVLIPYFVHRELGVRVRGLAERSLGNMRGLPADLFAAAGAVVGNQENGAELMRHGETLLVFPGGGREMPKFKGENYQLFWEGRSGFARLAIAHEYPIVPVGLVGGDDVYHSYVERDSVWGRASRLFTTHVLRQPGVSIPLVRGLGPTLIPRPQRMYLRFGAPIATHRPTRVPAATWEATVKERTQSALEGVLSDLQALRDTDPYRSLSPFGWSRARQPGR
ncbi:MAG: acyltransferase family protein [Mycobacterium sp.]|nr:acyltransferase family protein [Mycobacterium sp.]